MTDTSASGFQRVPTGKIALVLPFLVAAVGVALSVAAHALLSDREERLARLATAVQAAAIEPVEVFRDAQRSDAPVVALAVGLVVTALIAAYFFVTQRRTADLGAAQSELRDREERLRLTVDALADGGWDWNIETGEIFVSDRWLASLGYRRDEVDSRIEFLESIVHPEDLPQVRARLNAHFEGRSASFECEMRLSTRLGDYRWNRSRGRVVTRSRDGRALRMVGTDTDISERKLEEQERQRLAERVRDAQKLESLGLLAGGIAHDFNNLLAGVLGNADLALLRLPDDVPVRVELEEIKRSATRAADLTRQMLAYSGGVSFVREQLDLAGVIEEMAGLLESSVSKKATLWYELGDEPALVEGDPTQVRQVVMNLVTNASDALGDGCGTIHVRTGVLDVEANRPGTVYTTRTLESGRYATLQVEDSGIGMDASTVRKIFDPFFTTKFRGRGLGLAAVSGIVRALDGAIEVDSEPGRGTRVTALLPSSATVPNPAPSPGRRDIPRPGPHGVDTVLVVDDEVAVAKLVATALRSKGLKVLVSVDGRDGVETFRNNADAIDVVLLDATMPRLSGAEALREIRRVRPDVPIVLASGHTNRSVLDQFEDADLAGFLQKPFSVQELVSKVRTALARAHARRAQ